MQFFWWCCPGLGMLGKIFKVLVLTLVHCVLWAILLSLYGLLLMHIQMKKLDAVQGLFCNLGLWVWGHKFLILGLFSLSLDWYLWTTSHYLWNVGVRIPTPIDGKLVFFATHLDSVRLWILNIYKADKNCVDTFKK